MIQLCMTFKINCALPRIQKKKLHDSLTELGTRQYFVYMCKSQRVNGLCLRACASRANILLIPGSDPTMTSPTIGHYDLMTRRVFVK